MLKQVAQRNDTSGNKHTEVSTRLVSLFLCTACIDMKCWSWGGIYVGQQTQARAIREKLDEKRRMPPISTSLKGSDWSERELHCALDVWGASLTTAITWRRMRKLFMCTQEKSQENKSSIEDEYKFHIQHLEWNRKHLHWIPSGQNSQVMQPSWSPSTKAKKISQTCCQEAYQLKEYIQENRRDMKQNRRAFLQGSQKSWVEIYEAFQNVPPRHLPTMSGRKCQWKE